MIPHLPRGRRAGRDTGRRWAAAAIALASLAACGAPGSPSPAHAASARPARALLALTGGSGTGWYASSPGAENLVDPTPFPEATVGTTWSVISRRGLAWTGGGTLGRYDRTITRQLGPETFDLLVRARSWSLWSGVAQYASLGGGVWVAAGPHLGVWSGHHSTRNGISDPTPHPRAVWIQAGARLTLLVPVSRGLWFAATTGHDAGVAHASTGAYDSVWWPTAIRAEAALVLRAAADRD